MLLILFVVYYHTLTTLTHCYLPYNNPFNPSLQPIPSTHPFTYPLNPLSTHPLTHPLIPPSPPLSTPFNPPTSTHPLNPHSPTLTPSHPTLTPSPPHPPTSTGTYTGGVHTIGGEFAHSPGGGKQSLASLQAEKSLAMQGKQHYRYTSTTGVSAGLGQPVGGSPLGKKSSNKLNFQTKSSRYVFFSFSIVRSSLFDYPCV